MSDVLVLNFTYEALNITSFQRAVKLIFAGKAEMLHGARPNRSSSTTYEMRMPSIIRMLYYIRRPMQKVALTKKNVLMRDDHVCQYCGVARRAADDGRPHRAQEPRRPLDLGEPGLRLHALQQSQEQPHARTRRTWRLKRKPRQPKYIPWIQIKRNTLPGEWGKFLFLYNVSIDERVEA